MVQPIILTLNAGSSSIKFACFSTHSPTQMLCSGQISGLPDSAHFQISNNHQTTSSTTINEAITTQHKPSQIIAKILEGISRLGLEVQKIVAIAHRIVHGGRDFAGPVKLTPNILKQLEELIPLAPLHQPANLEMICAAQAVLPRALHIGCFDTAFHTSQAPLQRHYGLPKALTTEGIERYGFHGLSYEYISQRIAAIAPELKAAKVVVAHLGNGASVCGMQAGLSHNSSMGFSTLDGLLMGSRCGQLDPGVMLYLMQEKRFTVKQLEQLLYKESGLLGVSGHSNNMQKLLDMESDNTSAAEAIALFVEFAVKAIASSAASMGGVDALVFTGGIGEHSPTIRKRISLRLDWLGFLIDEQRNELGSCEYKISAECGKQAWVIPTNEELVLANHAKILLKSN